MEPSAPSTDFPGNIFFYAFSSVSWRSSPGPPRSASAGLARGQVGQPLRPPRRADVGLVPYLLGNSRVARPRYWYSGLLHSLI